MINKILVTRMLARYIVKNIFMSMSQICSRETTQSMMHCNMIIVLYINNIISVIWILIMMIILCVVVTQTDSDPDLAMVRALQSNCSVAEEYKYPVTPPRSPL